MHAHADRNWEIEFHQDRIFRPDEPLSAEIGCEEGLLSDILGELRRAELLPSYYSFELGIDGDTVGMEYYTRALIEAGASPSEAVDYFFVEVEGMTQTAWAEGRGVDQSTISGSVSRAKKTLD